MCPLISSHTQIMNSDWHIKALNEANLQLNMLITYTLLSTLCCWNISRNKCDIWTNFPLSTYPSSREEFNDVIFVFSLVFLFVVIFLRFRAGRHFWFLPVLWICHQSSPSSSPIGSVFSNESFGWSQKPSIKEMRAGYLLRSGSEHFQPINHCHFCLRIQCGKIIICKSSYILCSF